MSQARTDHTKNASGNYVDKSKCLTTSVRLVNITIIKLASNSPTFTSIQEIYIQKILRT